MDRNEAIKEVWEKQYEPPAYLEEFLDYHEMLRLEFDIYIDSIRNKDIWENLNGKWRLKYEIK